MRFVTGDLDLYRWKNKSCKLCSKTLSAFHLIECPGTVKQRFEMEKTYGIRVERVMKDPSLLNHLPNPLRKQAKKSIAERISGMIKSAEGRNNL